MANQSTKAWYWEYGIVTVVSAIVYVVGIVTILGG